MYTHDTLFNLLRAMACGVYLAAINPAAASTVLTGFDFDDELGAFENVPAGAAAALSVPGWDVASGSITDFGGITGRALAARNYAAGNALLLNIAIAPGFRVNLDGIAFDHFASGSGPTRWSIEINGNASAEQTTPTTFERVDVGLDFQHLTGVVQIALRGFDASSNNGTYRIDDFELRGEIAAVPLVPAAMLFGSAVALLPAFRRA